MTGAYETLALGAALLLGAILLGWVSQRANLPLLLVFLVVGMLAGEDGPGGIQFDDLGLSFLVGNLALAVILLDGGMRTRYALFRVAFAPALTLATLGVVLSAALVGAFAWAISGFDWRYGLLLGAIVGSTDAAAVFALLRTAGARLNERLAATLELESGMNDPMAVFLTIALIEIIRLGVTAAGPAILVELVLQFGIGGAAGVASGVALAWLLAHVRLSTGLQALLAAAGGVLVFAVTNRIGGSGFLAVYLAGLIVGNRATHAGEDALRAMDGFAWLAQAAMFLLLGLLVTPSQLPAIAWPALGLAVWLMLVARPAAVAACLAPFRFTPRETAFIAWVGLRGAVPIILALFPLLAGLDGARTLFNYAFFVVLMSLLVQGSTVAPAARLFGVALPPRPEPLARTPIIAGRRDEWEAVQFDVAPESRAAGRRPADLELPEGASLAGLFRHGARVPLSAWTMLEGGDVASLIARAADVDRLAELFAAEPQSGPLASRAVYGDFVLEGAARLGDVAQFYELSIAPADAGLTLEQYLRRALRRRPVPGDSVTLGRVRLTVREMDGDRITKVGLKLAPVSPPS
jgi:cell volume regulation protein A